MSKKLVTKQFIKRLGLPIITVGYCHLQTLLKHSEPFAYSKDTYGWSCDYYMVNYEEGKSAIISTGYNPISSIKVTFSHRLNHEDAAKRVNNFMDLAYEDKVTITNRLVKKFVKEVLENE